MSSRASRMTWAAALLCVGILAAGTMRVAAQGADPRPLHTPIPPRSDAGSWDGTWIYVSRDVRVVLWIKRDERLQVRLRYSNLNTAEGFETDWDGRTDYYHDGWPGKFELELDEVGENTITGSFDWKLDRDTSLRKDRAVFTLYRSGDGRSLVMRFDEYDRSMRLKDKVEVIPGELFWSFRKVSRRLARWEEIPF